MHPLIAHIATATVVPSGQGLKQIGELGLAFLLSSVIGLEREWRQKSAGLRTHTLVGVGAALFMLVSKYGFGDMIGHGVSLDPSRVAAQVVSGLGFIGGGLIFVRRDAVRGLTTAAIVWTTAAIGMACGAGLWVLAVCATAAHFIIVVGYRRLALALPRSRHISFGVRVTYEDGRGILRDVMRQCTDSGFSIAEVTTHRLDQNGYHRPAVAVDLSIWGQPHVDPLASRLGDMTGVLEVSARDLAEDPE
jgi:putative Mg2+ transporter-C (MgtC) family protein